MVAAYASAPKDNWKTIRSLLPKRMQPFARGLKKRLSLLGKKVEEPYRSVFPYTLAHPIRQRTLVKLAQQIDAENIPGAIVECGVLDGGMSALMGWATAQSGRKLHLFDAWQGLPETTEEDGPDGAKWAGEAVGSPARVKAALRSLNVSLDRATFHRGWFHETFPTADVGPVALVHADADFYEPTVLILQKWYPLLSPGGFIQFDDYAAFQGCRQAVDEFLAEHPEVKLEKIGTGAQAFFIRKPAA
jgi:O-methyltransferase